MDLIQDLDEEILQETILKLYIGEYSDIFIYIVDGHQAMAITKVDPAVGLMKNHKNQIKLYYGLDEHKQYIITLADPDGITKMKLKIKEALLGWQRSKTKNQLEYLKDNGTTS